MCPIILYCAVLGGYRLRSEPIPHPESQKQFEKVVVAAAVVVVVTVTAILQVWVVGVLAKKLVSSSNSSTRSSSSRSYSSISSSSRKVRSVLSVQQFLHGETVRSECWPFCCAGSLCPYQSTGKNPRGEFKTTRTPLSTGDSTGKCGQRFMPQPGYESVTKPK